MSEKKFWIDITGTVILSLDQIWPDGDAPENPTAKDVLEVLKGSGYSKLTALDDFGLEEDIKVAVTDSSERKDRAEW